MNLKSKKIFNIVSISVASFLVLLSFCGRYFNSFLRQVANFFPGCFGISFYGLMAVVIALSSLSLAGKNIKISKKYIVFFSLLFLASVLLIHTLTTIALTNITIGNTGGFATYANYVYHFYDCFPTMGGIVFGSIAYALQSVLTIYGAIIVYVLLIGVCVYFVAECLHNVAVGKLGVNENLSKVSQETDSQKDYDSTGNSKEQISEHDRAMSILFSHNNDGVGGQQVNSADENFGLQNTQYADNDIATNSTVSRNEAQNILFGNNSSQQSSLDSSSSNNFFANNNSDEQQTDTVNTRGFFSPKQDIQEDSWRITSTDVSSKNTQSNNYFSKFDDANTSVEKSQNSSLNSDSNKTFNNNNSFNSVSSFNDVNSAESYKQDLSEDEPIVADTIAVDSFENKNTVVQSQNDGVVVDEQINNYSSNLSEVEQTYDNNANKDVREDESDIASSFEPTNRQTSFVDTSFSETNVENESEVVVKDDTNVDESFGYIQTNEDISQNIDLVNDNYSSYSSEQNEFTDEKDICEDDSASDSANHDQIDAQDGQTDDESTTSDSTSDVETDDEQIIVPTSKVVEGGIQQGFDVVSKKEYEEQTSKVHHYLEYNVPPLDILHEPENFVDDEAEDRQKAAQAIIAKLKVFGIVLELSDIIVGPAFSRYLFKVLSQKTRMSDFAKYSDDIKACLEASSNIRIEAPVHGTNLVGIEVANKKRKVVALRTILESDEFKNAKGALPFVIGQDIMGRPVIRDLAKLPHLLVAGQTGSGKSVCVNCLIVSLLYKFGPEYLRFLMVDPKQVELSRYNGIPHMLTSKTITKVNDALAGMDYLIKEMQNRLSLFSLLKVQNIADYNKKINPETTQKLHYIVYVIDELAELMSQAKQQVESKISTLTAMSRATGIHLVVATQRPDVKIVTGSIKANLPARFALNVASQFDSRTIIDRGGAETLLGRGDMLFMDPSSAGDLERIQGAYVDQEVVDLAEYLKNNNETYFDKSASDAIFVTQAQEEQAAREAQAETENADKPMIDEKCKDALKFWLERNGGKASIASAQRALGIGFNRAGRIMNTLQELGYVETPEPSESNSKPVKVLVTLEKLDDLFKDKE